MKLCAGKTVLFVMVVSTSFLSFTANFEELEEPAERVGCLVRVLRKLRVARGIAAEVFAQEAVRGRIASLGGILVGGEIGKVLGFAGASVVERITGAVLYRERFLAGGAVGGGLIIGVLAEAVVRGEGVRLKKLVAIGLATAVVAGVGADVGVSRVVDEGINREIVWLQ